MKKYDQTFLLCTVYLFTQAKILTYKFLYKIFKKRYPSTPIGWSTHEDPESFCPPSLAKACGAEIFERHVGINQKNIN